MLHTKEEKKILDEIEFFMRFKLVIVERIRELKKQLEYGYKGARKIREPDAKEFRRLIEQNEDWLLWVGYHLAARGALTK